MSVCAVATCKNNKKNSNFIFHRFPHELSIRNKWISLCKRGDRLAKTLYMCSQHFVDSDYTRDLENELLNMEPRKKRFLKGDAVPSQHLPLQKIRSNDEAKVGRKIRYTRKENQEIVNNVLKSMQTMALFFYPFLTNKNYAK